MDINDLNIDNYNYEDLLNLFKLPFNFGESDLKIAKKTVMQMHPDKSGFHKKYFLFFSAAYKILFSVYQFREKGSLSEKLNPNNENIEYLAEKNKNNEEIIKSLKNKSNSDEFNMWFNKLFDEVKIENDYVDSGYGNWLKTNDDTSEQSCNNISEMNEQINVRKNKLRNNTIAKYNTINEFNSVGFCDLTNSRPEEYSSEMFSKLPYEDLKKAHEESVVPVTDKDFQQQYNSIDDIRYQRSQQHLEPMSDQASRDYLASVKNTDTFINSHRAYKLIKQQETIDNANKKWWSSLKQLK